MPPRPRAAAAAGVRGAAAAAIEPPLCAALDFDMAFTASSFVDMGSGRVGAAADDFARLLQREQLNFAEVLAGGDASSGVPPVAMRAVEEHSRGVRVARCALHDTLIRGYLRAYREEAGAAAAEAPFDPPLHRGAYAVVRMAIVVMADCLA